VEFIVEFKGDVPVKLIEILEKLSVFDSEKGMEEEEFDEFDEFDEVDEVEVDFEADFEVVFGLGEGRGVRFSKRKRAAQVARDQCQ